MDLINETTLTCKKISKEFWGKALELAQMNGWKPLGTHPPKTFYPYDVNADWHGSYLTNDGQVVLREDSILLTAALERSLADIPDTSPSIKWDASLWIMDDFPEWLTPDESNFMEESLEDFALDINGMHPFVFFAGNEKKHLIDLIRFCCLGNFSIF